MLIVKVLNAIKSYYVNYKVFPKEIARKRPIYISYKVKCSGLYKGAIEINSNNIYKGMIQIANKSSIGIKGSEFSYLNIVGSGKIVFEGSADFCKGISLNVFDNSVLKIGNNLFCNGGCTIRCRKKISIGSDNMWGWNVCMMDGDGHPGAVCGSASEPRKHRAMSICPSRSDSGSCSGSGARRWSAHSPPSCSHDP